MHMDLDMGHTSSYYAPHAAEPVIKGIESVSNGQNQTRTSIQMGQPYSNYLPAWVY